ncbi:MAG: DNA polymerase IV, partial [Polyangiaceae bacterium]
SWQWRAGEPLRLLGVSASHFVKRGEEPRQASLFDTGPAEDPRERRLNEAIDALRERFGFDTVARASQRRPAR